MKRLPLYINICLGLTLGLSACSDKESTLIAEEEASKQQPIVLTSGLNKQAGTTRAEGDPQITAFEKPTNIQIRMMSESTEAGTTTKYDTQAAKVDVADASADKSAVTLTTTRYWDDMHGINTHLSAFAMGIYGYTGDGTDLTNGNELAFNASNTNNNLSWKVSTTQTSATYVKEDLILSNNIQKVDASNDKRIGYLGTDNGFETGNLLFTHAMSRITLNIKISDEFSETEKAGINITLNNFAVAGTADVTTGTFTDVTKADITPIALETAAEGYTRSYEALVIPVRNWDAPKEKMATITLPGKSTVGSTEVANTFFAMNTDFNSQTLMDHKLIGNIKAGNHYIFNLNIKKTGLSLTANIIDWKANTPIDIVPLLIGDGVIGTPGSTNIVMEHFDLYMSQTAGTDYSKKSTCTWNTTDRKFTYDPKPAWPDHTNKYYFRAIGHLDDKGVAIKNDSSRPTPLLTDNKQIDLATCQTIGTEKVKAGTDLLVGAPYEADGSLTPGKTALEGVGGTGESSIHLIFKHMLSEIYVHLTTTTNEESRVNLTDAKVEILNSYTSGSVMTEDVKFTSLTGSRTDKYSLGTAYNNLKKLPGDSAEQTEAYTSVYRGYAIPQDLIYTDGGVNQYIQIKVTTKDGNIYYVNADNKVDGTSQLTSWVGGTQYLYNLELKKTGIVLTAQIQDWDTPIIANYDDVQIQ